MKKAVKNIALLFFAQAPVAWSQCGYAVNTGGGNCVRPDAVGMPAHDYNSDRPTGSVKPAPKWADQWGVIVMASTTEEYGTVIGRVTKTEAVKDVTKDYASQGAKQCKVMIAYYSQCAALAWGSRASSYSNGPSEKTVRDEALRLCSRVGKVARSFIARVVKPEEFSSRYMDHV